MQAAEHFSSSPCFCGDGKRYARLGEHQFFKRYDIRRRAKCIAGQSVLQFARAPISPAASLSTLSFFCRAIAHIVRFFALVGAGVRTVISGDNVPERTFIIEIFSNKRVGDRFHYLGANGAEDRVLPPQLFPTCPLLPPQAYRLPRA